MPSAGPLAGERTVWGREPPSGRSPCPRRIDIVESQHRDDVGQYSGSRPITHVRAVIAQEILNSFNLLGVTTAYGVRHQRFLGGTVGVHKEPQDRVAADERGIGFSSLVECGSLPFCSRIRPLSRRLGRLLKRRASLCSCIDDRGAAERCLQHLQSHGSSCLRILCAQSTRSRQRQQHGSAHHS